MSDAEQILITVEEPIVLDDSIPGSRDGGRDIGGSFDGPDEPQQGWFKKRVPVDAQVLRTQMNGMLKVVQGLFDEAEQQTSMELSEVTLSVEILADGTVSILGTGGGLTNKGGITLKLTRPK